MAEEALMVGTDTHNSQMDRFAMAVFATVAPLLIILAGTGAFVWLQASQEAAAFNRLTNGPKVTTWDAVWLDLRVEAR